MTVLLLVSWAGIALAMTILWWVHRRSRDATSVDVAWSAALAVLAPTYALAVDGDPARRALVGVLGGIWAARLALFLYTNRVRTATGEDGRYRALREHWGPNAQRNFFLFYQGQAAVAMLFSLPLLAAMRGGPLDGWAVLGALIWVTAVAGEAVADAQLARFRAESGNRGKVCREGLWKYSRHPNYFFEWVHWWAYVAIGAGALLTWIGPIMMLLFLFRLTGIPYTELQAAKSRGEAYREYQRTTSVFVPWFPRSPR